MWLYWKECEEVFVMLLVLKYVKRYAWYGCQYCYRTCICAHVGVLVCEKWASNLPYCGCTRYVTVHFTATNLKSYELPTWHCTWPKEVSPTAECIIHHVCWLFELGVCIYMKLLQIRTHGANQKYCRCASWWTCTIHTSKTLLSWQVKDYGQCHVFLEHAWWIPHRRIWCLVEMHRHHLATTHGKHRNGPVSWNL